MLHFFEGFPKRYQSCYILYSEGVIDTLFKNVVQMWGVKLNVKNVNLFLMKTSIKTGRYKGPWDCLRSVFKQEGLRGCYRGLGIQGRI